MFLFWLSNTFSKGCLLVQKPRHHMRSDQSDPKRPPAWGTEAEECKVTEVRYMRELRDCLSHNLRLPCFCFPSLVGSVHLWSNHLRSRNLTNKTFPCSLSYVIPWTNTPADVVRPMQILGSIGATWHLKTGSVAFPVCSHLSQTLQRPGRCCFSTIPLPLLIAITTSTNKEPLCTKGVGVWR